MHRSQPIKLTFREKHAVQVGLNERIDETDVCLLHSVPCEFIVSARDRLIQEEEYPLDQDHQKLIHHVAEIVLERRGAVSSGRRRRSL